LLRFSRSFSQILGLLLFFSVLYLISKYVALYFIFFSIILIDKTFLWNILEIKSEYLFCDICC